LALWTVVLAIGLAPATAGAAERVYVTNFEGNASSVSQYAIGAGGGLSPLSPATVAAGVGAFAVAVTPNGQSAYVTSFTGVGVDRSVFQYDIDPLTGALSPKTPATVDAEGADAVTVAPDGRTAYVLDSSAGAVLQYNIDPVSGALAPKTPASVAAGGASTIPFSVAVTPEGKSAYVATFNSGVLQYDINPLTGALSSKTPAGVAAGNTPEGVVVTPDGKSAYVTNINSGTISQYNIDPITGTLSPKSRATVPTGKGPTNGIAVAPDGKSAYVYNSGIGGGDPPGNTVSQYDIDPITGVLSPKTPAAVAAAPGSTESGLAVTPDGHSAYVVNSSVVSQYSIDPITGALSSQVPATVPTGGGSTGIAVASLPRGPTSKEQCKNGGWRNFPQFKNQGDCVSFVQTGK
jgi:DNA-binding beta-propeller fold protein YncE